VHSTNRTSAYPLPAPYDKLAWGLDRFDLVVMLISFDADALQGEQQLRAQLEEDLAHTQRRLEAAEKVPPSGRVLRSPREPKISGTARDRRIPP
jgi:hypothetical protein